MSDQITLPLPEEAKLKYYKIKSSTVEEMKDLLGSIKGTKEQDMQERIKELEDELKHLRNTKKYGLVWDSEKEPEQVVVDCQNKLPILEEVKDRKIISDDSGDSNLLIEGDNYHSLQVLSYTHKEAIDVIYIDPPYNTENNDFIYNDKIIDKEDTYRHSKWLNFMEKRILLAYDLLTENGSLFCSIDDRELPRLLLLLEEIFGEENIKTICVKMSEATGVKMASVVKNGRIPKLKEYVIIAKKNGINNLYLEKTPKEKWDDEYNTIISNATVEEINFIKDIRDNEERTEENINICDKIISKWEYVSVSNYFKEHNINKKDELSFKYKNSFRIIQVATLTGGARNIAEARKNVFSSIPNFFSIITPKKKMYLIKGNFNEGAKLPRCKVLFADDYLTIHPGDFWSDIKTTGLDNEGGVQFKNGKKPLKLIERILSTNVSTDISILDFFSGSGTTGEAVINLNNKDGGNRKFILCTNNESKICESITFKRIQGAIKKNSIGNLRYYKTAFVEVENLKEITDEKKLELTYNAGELLAIKEGIYNERIKTEYGQVFENSEDVIAVYFKESTIHLEEMATQLAEIQKEKGGKVIWYIYGNPFQLDAFPMVENLELKDIPDPILKVYREINKV